MTMWMFDKELYLY